MPNFGDKKLLVSETSKLVEILNLGNIAKFMKLN